MSDYQLEDTVYIPFTTRQFSDGVPTALVSGEVQIYEDASVTQITGAETLTVSLDGIAGFNMVQVAMTAANGFESGKSYTLVLSAGTVGGTSVVGEVVGHFTIEMSAASLGLAAGVVLADSADHGGSATVLTADHLVVSSSTDHGISVASSAASKHAAYFASSGTGASYALALEGNTTSGVGLYCYGDLNGAVMANTTTSAQNGLRIISNGTGAALYASAGGSAGDGLELASANGDVLHADAVSAIQSGLSTLTAANVNAEVDSALNTAIPGSPTPGSVNDIVKDLDAVLPVAEISTLTAANINTQVSDVLKTDTITLPGKTAPPLAPTFEQALSYLYKAFRNKQDQTASDWQLYDDAGSVVDQTAPVTDAAGTTTRGEVVAGA